MRIIKLLLVLAALCPGFPSKITQGEGRGQEGEAAFLSRSYFDTEITRYQSKIQQLIGKAKVDSKDVALASKEELSLLWNRVGELYRERNELFNARGLNFGLRSTNTASHM